MNVHDKTVASATPELIKLDPSSPCLAALGNVTIAVKAGTSFNGVNFDRAMPVAVPASGYLPGYDYVVTIVDGEAVAFAADSIPQASTQIGGFHFAPGGNATARAGGDDVPAINPFSIWDRSYRPACADPRGMTCVDGARGKFWCDIYLLGAADLANGTSKFGVIIADGNDRPLDANGKTFKRFDYDTAVEVTARHGKGLLSIEDFFAAAYGVTEKTAHKGDPESTGLDAPRTSKWGVMQATGNLWVWGHDGDPDQPRASFFGGSWWAGDGAGSRFADVGNWSGDSNGYLGARGRSDHLQLG